MSNVDGNTLIRNLPFLKYGLQTCVSLAYDRDEHFQGHYLQDAEGDMPLWAGGPDKFFFCSSAPSALVSRRPTNRAKRHLPNVA
jgi:hypothetical protein